MNFIDVYAAPPLPFEPEPCVELLARYPAALATAYDQQIGFQILSGLIPPPRLLREHVFDFASGIRMIVTLSVQPSGRRMVDFVFSDFQSGRNISLEAIRDAARELVQQFGGFAGEPAFSRTIDGCLEMLYWEESNVEAFGA